jgi:hypothetical protein
VSVHYDFVSGYKKSSIRGTNWATIDSMEVAKLGCQCIARCTAGLWALQEASM